MTPYIKIEKAEGEQIILRVAIKNSEIFIFQKLVRTWIFFNESHFLGHSVQ